MSCDKCCFAAFTVNVTAKVQSVTEISVCWTIFSVAKRIMVMHHREPECHAKRLCCHLHGHILKYDLFLLYCIFRTADLFATKLSLRVLTPLSPISFVKRLGCCVQGQGHSDGSKLHWIFVSPILLVLLISLQPNCVCWGITTNKQTLCKQSGHNCMYGILTIAVTQYLGI